MLKIDKVEYGIIPYGSGAGQSALSIYASNTADESYDSLSDADKADKSKKIFADKIITDIKAKAAAVNPSAWASAMVFNSSYISLVFCGADWYMKDNVPLTMAVHELLQRESLNVQIPMAKKHGIKDVRPPFAICVCEPLYTTGTNDCYQLFNAVVIKAPLRYNGNPLDETTVGKALSSFAIVEMCGHNFKDIVFEFSDADDIATFKKFYASDYCAYFYPPSVVLMPMNIGISDEVKKLCLTNAYRYQEPLSDYGVLSLEKE